MSAYISVEILGGVWGFIGSLIIIAIIANWIGNKVGYKKGKFEGFREGAIAGVNEKYAEDNNEVQK